jgi:Transposase DDE domain group 1
VKVARAQVQTKVRTLPTLKFADQQMTSFGGLIVFQHFFANIGLFERLAASCGHLRTNHYYAPAAALRCLVVHLLLGYRRLREMDFYRHDPLVQRVVGLKQLPSVPTLSRMLSDFDSQSVCNLRAVNRELILERLVRERATTLTLDFDGSVQSTRRHAEGTAVGFNKVKKGARSYYPLFCVLGQTGQVFDLLHRSGNVHDSKGAVEFVRQSVAAVRERLPAARIEARLDSAFFSDEMVAALDALQVEYTISVPFERFVVLKKVVSERTWWWQVPGSQERTHFFEWRWKPQRWRRKRRFVFIRKTVALQQKEPIQLDLFAPVESGFDYKVIVTNKEIGAGRVARFHEGRGSQEKVYAELKSQAQMDYIPCRRLVPNQLYLLCSMLVHNLNRELQMQAAPPARGVSAKRTVLWVFEELATLRRTILQRAGRLTRPQGRLTLTLPNIPALQAAILRLLPAEL